MIQEIECERCSGTGELICDRCGGAGTLPGFATWGGGFTSCDVCYGSGYITCPECNGDGYIEKDDDEDEDDEWDDDEEDDNGSVFNESNNSPLPITGEHSAIHTDVGRIYTINNKKYLLTNQGFRREHNGNIYRFSYEKSMELIKNVEAVVMDETNIGYPEVQETMHNNITTESTKEEPTESSEESVKALIDHIYIVNNKEYLLTNEGFRRKQNGNTYRFSNDKSMELIKNGQAVSTGDVVVQNHPMTQVETDSKSNDVVSIDINSEIVEKITYEYHNKRVTTYNKSGHTIRHWGVPYNLFLDYVNSNHHYEFRKKYFAAYGPKILEKYREDFIFFKFEEEIAGLLSANSIESIVLQEIKSDGGIVYIGGIRLISRFDYSLDNIRGYRLNDNIEFFPYTPKPAYYDDRDEGYWFLVSKSLSKQQLSVLSTVFDYKDVDWFYELGF